MVLNLEGTVIDESAETRHTYLGRVASRVSAVSQLHGDPDDLCWPNMAHITVFVISQTTYLLDEYIVIS